MKTLTRRAAATAALAIFGTLPLASAATAAPTHAKNASFDVIDCGDGPVSIVSNGGQNVDKTVFTPGHLLDGNGVVIPDTFETTFTIIDVTKSTNLFSDSETDAKGNSTNALRDPITCTFGGSETFVATADDVAGLAQEGVTGVDVGDTVTFTFSGTATGFAPGHH